jgi:hypothetical protein
LPICPAGSCAGKRHFKSHPSPLVLVAVALLVIPVLTSARRLRLVLVIGVPVMAMPAIAAPRLAAAPFATLAAAVIADAAE